MHDGHEAHGSCCTPGRAEHGTQHQPIDPIDNASAGGQPFAERQPVSEGRASHGAGVAPAREIGNGHEESLVRLPGGTFIMGTDSDVGFPDDGEGPARSVEVAPFRIDAYTVTNRRFAQFVEETGYKSEAERYGWSFVFHLFVPKRARKGGLVREVPGLEWWLALKGAYWRHPEGKGSGIQGRLDHPVTHISWNDAQEYCRWVGARLPTEAEWEYAARGGLEQATYPWGEELTPNGEHRCNIWQGTFPTENSAEDGYEATCPVDEYKPNGYGLYNVAGNVWEWCSDVWAVPVGSAPKSSGPDASRVMRGGSYLCHHSYCNRYRVAARSSNTPDSSTGNMGFRVAVSEA